LDVGGLYNTAPQEWAAGMRVATLRRLSRRGLIFRPLGLRTRQGKVLLHHPHLTFKKSPTFVRDRQKITGHGVFCLPGYFLPFLNPFPAGSKLDEDAIFRGRGRGWGQFSSPHAHRSNSDLILTLFR
jgi:hypothetical protein